MPTLIEPSGEGEAFQTALIARLANEIFFEDHRRAPAPVPAAPVEPIPTTAPAFPDTEAAPTGAVSDPRHSDPQVLTPRVGPEARATRAPPVSRAPAPAAAPSAPVPALPFGEPEVPGILSLTRRPAPAGPVPGAPAEFYFLAAEPRVAAPETVQPRLEPVHVDPFSAPRPPGPLGAFDVQAIRRDFPALHQTVNGHPLIWLDNAATTHKPQSVIDITSEFYARHNSNIHRAAHTLAERSTDLFEGARDKLRDFIGAASSKEIVFLRGTTEAINLVAESYGSLHVGEGDEILITHIEHHANIVPWQLLSRRTGAVLRVAPVNDRGELILEEFARLLNHRTRIVSVTHVANALGTINPVAEIIQLAHAIGVPVLVDAAQSSPHIPLDVRALDADFLVLSGHKIFGPTGIGILYGKAELLDSLPPWQGGGHMIHDVTFARTEFNHIPEKFEAGTPDIAGAVGLGAAVDYLTRVGLPAIAAHEHALLDYATEALASVKGLRIIGTARQKASVLSFVVNGLEPEAVSRHLDRQGIATRSGHHCAQPALRRFGLEKTVRASLALYNTREDVDALVRALHLLPKG
ncbi:SufS family cysteine desulfurase [Segnochrobactraceae bacterium EtOH-i3]